jgi:hypothetical protein
MIFPIDLKFLRRQHPPTYVRGEPGELQKGEYHYEAYFRLEPEKDVLSVDVRPVSKETDHD